MDSVAIVVTYNRLDMLKRTISALLVQDSPCDILIINNASTDGTEQYIFSLMEGTPRILYSNTGSNVGGAGGFHYGLTLAVKYGYKYAWIMDDDCIPHRDALSALIKGANYLDGHFGWLSSIALWTDGTECKMNRQKLKKSFYEFSHLLQYTLVQAEQATFVSLFIPLTNIKKYGLPVKEFFIWGDDIEFTRRLAVRCNLPSFVVGNSIVVHAMKTNRGSNIATDTPERLPRYFYAYRNEFYLYKKEGLKGILYYFAKCGYHMLRILMKHHGCKAKRLKYWAKGILAGVTFNPEIEYPTKKGDI